MTGGSCLYTGADGRRGVGIEWPAWARGEVGPVAEAEAQPLEARPGDHRAIVGAERRRRRDEIEAMALREIGEPAAQRDVGGDAAGDDEAAAGGVGRTEKGPGVGGPGGAAVARPPPPPPPEGVPTPP